MQPVQSAAAVQESYSSVVAALSQVSEIPLELAASVSTINATTLTAARQALVAEIRRCVLDVNRTWERKSGSLYETDSFTKGAIGHVTDTAWLGADSYPTIANHRDSLTSPDVAALVRESVISALSEQREQVYDDDGSEGLPDMSM